MKRALWAFTLPLLFFGCSALACDDTSVEREIKMALLTSVQENSRKVEILCGYQVALEVTGPKSGRLVTIDSDGKEIPVMRFNETTPWEPAVSIRLYVKMVLEHLSLVGSRTKECRDRMKEIPINCVTTPIPAYNAAKGAAPLFEWVDDEVE